MSAAVSGDTPATDAPVLRLGRGMGSPRWRASRALLISLLVHALLLSLTLGGEGFGLPGLGLPWQARRAQEPDLQVRLEAPPLPAAQPPLPMAAAAIEAAAQPPGERSDAKAATPAADSAPASSTASLRADSSSDLTPSPSPEPALIAMPRADAAKWMVPATPVLAASAPTITQAASAPISQPTAQAATQLQARVDLHAWERALERAELERARQEARQQAEQQEQARLEAARLEAARLEAERQAALKLAAARLEAQRQEAARAEAARLEAQRLAVAREEANAAAARQEAARHEAAKQEAVRAEAARQETERQEALRQAAARQEAARQEAARQEAARAEAARQEAERQDAARQAAAKQEAARQEAARQDAARQDAARQEAAGAEAAKLAAAQAEIDKREAKLRAIGRQLNEEADRRDAAAAAAARQSPALPPSQSSLRRGRLFGRSDANAELILYAEAWARKIQLNQTFELVREAVKQPHADPLVTVAIRSDGTLESVSFVRSSGVPAVDEAIRRVLQSQANYPAFQPALAREYDVIEIRRSWHFDMAIRLY